VATVRRADPVEVEPTTKEAIQVIVTRRWPWQQDDVFYNEGPLGVNINAGVLTIEMPDEIHSYAPGRWKKVVSSQIHGSSPAEHPHEH